MSRRTFTITGLLILIALLIAGCAGSRVSSSAGVNDNARAMEDMGVSLIQQGELRAGLEQLLKAVELDARNPDLHHELALVYRDLEQYDLSLQHFKRALDLKPEFPEANNNLGTLYLLMEKWDSAIESFQAAVDDLLYKTPHLAYNNMGWAYYNKGEYEKAIESYLMALKEFPGYASCYVNLGIAYEALNRTNKAIDAYNNSIRYEPQNAPPYFRLGKLYNKIGRNDDSLSALKKFIDLAKEGTMVVEARRLVKSIENQNNLP